MAKFMLLFRGGTVTSPAMSPVDRQAQIEKWSRWTGALVQAGHHVQGGHPLHRSGHTLRGAAATLTEAPHSEPRELVTGNVIVEASSLAEATELAKGCPVLELDGSVEIRPILDRPT